MYNQIHRDKSTLDKAEYIVENIMLGVIVGYYTLKILPAICFGNYYHQNTLSFVLCMAIASIIGIAITYQYNRTNWALLGNICTGIGK